jgi:hypothetical protein
MPTAFTFSLKDVIISVNNKAVGKTACKRNANRKAHGSIEVAAFVLCNFAKKRIKVI